MRGSIVGVVTVAVLWLPGSFHGQDKPGEKLDQYGDPLPAGAVARKGTGRFRQFDREVVFTPDGKELLTSTGTAIVVWSGVNGRTLRQFPAQSTGRILLSPDGKLLATSTGSEIQVFEWTTRRNRRPCHLGVARILCSTACPFPPSCFPYRENQAFIFYNQF